MKRNTNGFARVKDVDGGKEQAQIRQSEIPEVDADVDEDDDDGDV